MTHTTAARPLPWLGLFALLALAAFGGRLGSAAAPLDLDGKKLTFEVHVEAADPFHALNKVGAADAVPKVRRGETVRVVIRGTPAPGWHTYPIEQLPDESVSAFRSTLALEKVKGAIALPPVIESPPEVVKEEGIGLVREYSEPFTWIQEVAILPDAAPGKLVLPLKVRTQICKGSCLKVDETLTASVEVSPEEPMPLSGELAERIKAATTPPSTPANPKSPGNPTTTPAAPKKGEPKGSVYGFIEGSHDEYAAAMKALEGQFVRRRMDQDLLTFLLAGIFWGAVSLVTPCVFPMIPITVSFFLKQSEKEHHRPIVMAGVYSLTIVIVLTLAAAFLLSIFRWLSLLPLTNYFLGALFIFFALSLFGMYEIELPSFLAQYTSAKEGKGGLIGTIFMALTFTIISFACVAPFLGGFSGTAAAARPFWQNLLGGLAFSATFAAPFFVLALFPSLLRAMPKSGAWLNSVKVVMGFLEIAASFKFFRQAELRLTAGEPWFFTFDLVLGVWIALCLLCGLYLLGVFRLPHDSPQDHVGVPRLLFSIAFLGLAFYLLPALFKVDRAGQPQQPSGTIFAWINSFLLPESRPGEGHVPSTGNLPFAIAQAREARKQTGQPKRIFIDFTGFS